MWKIFRYVSCAILLVFFWCLIVLFICRGKLVVYGAKELNEVIPPKRCRFVYLDFGTNKGVQIRKLYEPWLYPKAPILRFYNKLFGKDYHRSDICAFGFEANPRHMKRLRHIEEAYKNNGLNLSIFNYAVSNRSDDNITVYFLKRLLN